MRNIFYFLYKILLIPHVILYITSKNKSVINQDLLRWSETKRIHKNNHNLLLHFLAHSKDFRTIFYFRIKSPLKYILSIYCRKQSNFTIDISTKLGGGILTGHPYCTILNAESIGENFYVNHLVTVGEVNGKRPKIGNNVSIYTGAIVIGDITIGDNAIIGAGSVVVKDIPENAVAVGNPAKIIKHKGNKIDKNDE
tara:strand:+ start:9597 stop:10184 length:588 start_codon:yes stop_codon:yes gene_type:complete